MTARSVTTLLLAACLPTMTGAGDALRVSTPKLNADIPSNGRLGGVAIDATGNIFVANFSASVWRIDPAGKVTRLPLSLQGASGNAVDADGNLYQASFSDGRLMRVTPAGKVETWVASGLDGPVGVAVAPDGSLYVCNCRGNSIVRVGADRRVELLAKGGDLDCPNGIAIDGDGRPIVVSFKNGHVLQLAVDGTLRRIATLPGPNAHVAVTSHALYVTQVQDNRVVRVERNGKFEPYSGTGVAGFKDGVIGEATLSRPNGIAVLPGGLALIVNTLEGSWRGTEPTRIVLRRIDLPATVSGGASPQGR